MKLPARDKRRGPGAGPGSSTARRRGFTMVEIAICLAVIGFALVAIIGVLPTGIQVQKDNREDSIINQDGTYFVEALRNGALGLDELTNYVVSIRIEKADAMKTTTTNYTYGVPKVDTFSNGREIIGLLTTPKVELLDNTLTTNRITAQVRAISGSAAEKPPAISDVAFAYQLRVENDEFMTASADMDPTVRGILTTNIHLASHVRELRLEFRWPVLPKGGVGTSRQVFRALVNAKLVNEPDRSRWYFFRQ